MHFYDRVRIWRARKLELQFRPRFENVSHGSFREPPEPREQPWYTRDLAVWFTVYIPIVALIGTILCGVGLVFGWLPVEQSRRDIYALRVSFALLLVTIFSFLVKGALIRRRDSGPKRGK
jgi:hypothetical protein